MVFARHSDRTECFGNCATDSRAREQRRGRRGEVVAITFVRRGAGSSPRRFQRSEDLAVRFPACASMCLQVTSSQAWVHVQGGPQLLQKQLRGERKVLATTQLGLNRLKSCRSHNVVN